MSGLLSGLRAGPLAASRCLNGALDRGMLFDITNCDSTKQTLPCYPPNSGMAKYSQCYLVLVLGLRGTELIDNLQYVVFEMA